jgi:hypothetical protein
MEQQSISISKAGIVATLRARCSVIAAANPLQGRYNSQLSFSENIDLSEPILSRFDILNVIRDEVNEEIDSNLSTFVINSHIKNHPYKEQFSLRDDLLPETVNTDPPIESSLLKEYIRYAREKCHPELTDKHVNIIKQFYVKLREESKTSGGMNVAVRHIESIIRVSVGNNNPIQLMQRYTCEARFLRRTSTWVSNASWSRSFAHKSTAWPTRFGRTSAHTSDLHCMGIELIYYSIFALSLDALLAQTDHCHSVGPQGDHIRYQRHHSAKHY